MARILLVTVILAHISSLATAIGNLTSAGCIDAAGFEKCQAAAAATETACLDKADADQSSLETVACGCESYIENYNCYAASCWNRVWECEYQEYMVGYFTDCSTAVQPVPYFPIPDNVQDACSCNVGNVYLAITDSITQGASCSNNVSSTSEGTNAVYLISDCECCTESSVASSIYGICPDTDPSLIGLSTVDTLGTNFDNPFSGCASSVSNDICEAQLGWPEVAGGTYYGPNNLPASGTATLSNQPGTVTSPASGAVFSYTNGANKQVYTITAASVGKAVATTTSGSKSVANAGTTTATGTGPAASTKANSGSTTVVGRKIFCLGAGLALLAAIF